MRSIDAVGERKEREEGESSIEHEGAWGGGEQERESWKL